MSRYQSPEPLPITLRGSQLALIMLSLAGLCVAALLLIYGAMRFSESADVRPVVTATPDPLIGTPSSTPVLGQITDPGITPTALIHIVAEGENLTLIAAQYNVPLDILMFVNHITDSSTIVPGQQLLIPGPAMLTPTAPMVTPLPSLTPTLPPLDPYLGLASGWPRSTIDGDLASGYPLVTDTLRTHVHYQPGTYPEKHLGEVLAYLDSGLALVEARLGVHLEGVFDIYLAGTLFEDPDIKLRGRSFSKDRRVFILLDGSGTPQENAYLIAHELTHVVAWNTWGTPSSTMLSEGLATYAAGPLLDSAGFLPADQLCLALNSVGQLPSMPAIEREPKQFEGHIHFRFNYFASSCFVKYLIDFYGIGTFSQLYHSSDYESLYEGRTLAGLDADWQATLAARQGELTADPQAMIAFTSAVNRVYDLAFDVYDGTPKTHQAYLLADQARIALWQADYAAVQSYLDQFYQLTGFTP
jgi:LysM repeat protein